jgi:hypothetical protein
MLQNFNRHDKASDARGVALRGVFDSLLSKIPLRSIAYAIGCFVVSLEVLRCCNGLV